MAAWTKLGGAVEYIMEKVINFASDQFVVALTNTAPGSESTPPTGATGTNILANITQVSYTNLSTRNITTSSSGQSGGTHTVVFTDLVLSASGGSVAAFRYIYLEDDTPTSPADPLLAYADYGSALTLANGESLTLDFAASTITLV